MNASSEARSFEGFETAIDVPCVPQDFVNPEDSVRHLRINEVTFVVGKGEAGLVVAVAIGLGLVLHPCTRRRTTGVSSITFSHLPHGPFYQTQDRTSFQDIRASCSPYRSDVLSGKVEA